MYTETVNNILSSLTDWAQAHGIKLLIILAVAAVIWRYIGKWSHGLFHILIRKKHLDERPDEEVEQRVKTLADVFNATIKVVVIFVILLMVLSEFGISIAGLLAGAGIAGLAIGFGGQNLVRDVIAGIFILLEDQYAKGDVVKVAGIAGMVDDINLRKTVLRDLDGVEHHIPNGEITVASNMTKDFSRTALTIGISYETDVDKAVSVINGVGQGMADDPDWKDMIISPPKVLGGIDEFDDSSVNFKVLAETAPLKQWDVKREFLTRLKKKFDEEGIEIPYPHRTIIERKA